MLVSTFVTALSLFAEQPKLVVGIVVDGLQLETLELLRPAFETNGFNRFLERGVVVENVDFGTNLDATAATALVMTGASPRVNGIGGERFYEAEARRSVAIFNDEKAMGNYTDESLSPGALRISTISDEARIAGAGVTYSHSIAINPAVALILGSHTGNSSIWFNDRTGNWATTTYYRDTPASALNANRAHSLINRLDTMQWRPTTMTATVSSLPDHLVHYPFRYTFPAKEAERFVKYAGSPLIQSDIVSLATQYIDNEELGKHDGIDVLNLEFSLQPFEYSKTAENRYELYDSYVKLDKNLAEFFNQLDKKVGRDNVVVYLAGTPSRRFRRKDDEKWNIPGGEFSSRKAVSLLNLYLIALHGNGEWVKGFYNGHFYLNEDLAKKQDLDIGTLRRQSADFLVRMSGVVRAYTIDDIIGADASVSNAQGQSRNTVVEQAGDVVIDLVPGWSLLDDFNSLIKNSQYISTEAPAVAPFLLSAPGVAPERVEATVDARAIAPTISKVLRIRAPNGSEVPPISLKSTKK